MSEPTPSTDQKEPTPEELKQMRDKLVKYYTEQNEVLEMQSNFHRYKADIAENIAREYLNQVRFAQMKNGPPKGETNTEKI